MPTEIFFESIQNEIKALLHTARNSIKITLAYFTDKEIFSLLCLKADEGVKVELIISDEAVNFDEEKLNFDLLTRSGGALFVLLRENKGILHNKLCIIDERIVLTGSFNWSYQAQRNLENLTVIEDESRVTDKALLEFERIKELASPKLQTALPKILKTGFEQFDAQFGGFYLSTLNVFCYYTQTGMTSLLLSIIKRMLQVSSEQIAFFSLADTRDNIFNKFLSIHSGISIDKIYSGKLEEHDMKRLFTSKLQIDHLPLQILETFDSDLSAVKSTVKKLKYTTDLRCVFIENLERLGYNPNRITKKKRFDYLEPTIIELKRFSLETGVPIVCSLGLTTDSGKEKDILVDDTGIVEDYADTIFSLYKLPYYDIITNESTSDVEYRLRNLKNRHGLLDSIMLEQNFLTKEFTERQAHDFRSWRPGSNIKDY